MCCEVWGARICKEKVANSRKTVKSALKKGPKETIKIYKYELIVDVRIRVQYTRKKNKVRKQVYPCLGEGHNFIRNTLL